jgi:putative ABC transport system ATP-binding protein/lipoprotein-releasing system ATP-binding protein
MIVAENLTKIYRIGDRDIEAVVDVGFKIEDGEFVSIVGHSGSGKTTLLSMIGGLTKPTRGRVLIDDVDIWSLSETELSTLRNEKIGFMFQFSSLIPTLTALENVMLPATFSHNKKWDVAVRGEEMLDLVELSHRINSYPSQLSGGEQRRVAIARALINKPKIILADEPTGDLDHETERDVMDLFLKINKEFGTTFLLVTHNPDLAKKAERRLVMDQGRIIEDSR